MGVLVSKIEFSRRDTDAVPIAERSDGELAQRLGARAVILNHYPPVHAIEQKVDAFAELGLEQRLRELETHTP